MLPNGDWRNVEFIEHYLSAEALLVFDRKKFAAAFSTALTFALAGSLIPLYPRSRWTGADLTADRAGLLLACHGLVFHVYPKFAADASSRSAEHGPRHTPRLPILEIEAADAEGGSAADANVGAGVGAPAQQNQAAAPSWQEENEKHRRQTLRWVLSEPLGQVVMLRLCLEPLRNLLSKQLRIAGRAWDEAQRLKQLKAVKAGDSSYQRHFRITVAAEQTLENEFMQQVRALMFEHELWSVMPPRQLFLEDAPPFVGAACPLGDVWHRSTSRATAPHHSQQEPDTCH